MTDSYKCWNNIVDYSVDKRTPQKCSLFLTVKVTLRMILQLILTCMFLISLAPDSQAREKNVLVIGSYDKGLSWNNIRRENRTLKNRDMKSKESVL